MRGLLSLTQLGWCRQGDEAGRRSSGGRDWPNGGMPVTCLTFGIAINRSLFRMRSAHIFSLLCTLSILGVVRISHAERSSLPSEIGYARGEMESPRSAAMGGALRALGNSLDGLNLNPASMAATRVYHIGAVAQIWPQSGRQSYGAAAVDSILNPQRIAGGIAVTTTRQDPDGLDRSSLDMRFGVAVPLSDMVFAGATVKYLTLGQEGYPADALPPSRAASGLSDEAIVRELSVDSGLIIKPIPELALAVMGSNLTDPDTSFMPLMVGGGIGFGVSEFSIEADVNFDLTTFEETTMQVQAGAEALIAGQVALRGGFSYDEAFERQALSAGAGFLADAFSVDAAVRFSVAGPTATAFVLGLRYHLDGAGIVTAPR